MTAFSTHFANQTEVRITGKPPYALHKYNTKMEHEDECGFQSVMEMKMNDEVKKYNRETILIHETEVMIFHMKKKKL